VNEFNVEAIDEKIGTAIERLFERDAHLLTGNANERSISHRLALHLQDEFQEWDVDCEYNRKGHGKVKKLELPIESTQSDDTEAKTVFPDIIVHRRTTDDNLLVIEVKKTTSQVPNKTDFQKLNAFKEQLGYRHALFLKLITGHAEVGISEKCWID
jgi:hypothetical protein